MFKNKRAKSKRRVRRTGTLRNQLLIASRGLSPNSV